MNMCKQKKADNLIQNDLVREINGVWHSRFHTGDSFTVMRYTDVKYLELDKFKR